MNEQTIERNNKSKNQSKSKHILLIRTPCALTYLYIYTFAWPKFFLLISLLLRHTIVEFMSGSNNNNNNNNGIEYIANRIRM